MSTSDQTIILSRKTLLIIMVVGIGLLTVSYVLGVQVGKQSVIVKHGMSDNVEENLKKLPASIHDQIKAIESQLDGETFETHNPEPSVAVASVDKPVVDKTIVDKPVSDSKQDSAKKNNLSTTVKPNVKAVQEATNKKKAEHSVIWTIQLMSTPDLAEAKRMINKAQASGFAASIISDKGLYKVRLAKVGPRELIDGTITKLKNRGFKPFALKL